jgi:NAD(P)-dependent dehydrogenase (short-subunit alcohol dehydrogenase family)
MNLDSTHVVVTGAAGGIGRALARRFHAAGAHLTLSDLDTETDTARLVAVSQELNAKRPGSAVALATDISTRDGNAALITFARQNFGEVDLFFANAGVGMGTDLASTTDHAWDTSFNVNVHAHRWAAEMLMPEWLERGRGYFCSTASAAGLLAQIGSAPYSVTKHAAVAFAEWLSITYHDRGIRVSCLCPQGVNTNMLNPPDMSTKVGTDKSFASAGDVVKAAGAVLEPEDVAEAVLAAIESEQFLILPHPEVATYMATRATQHERWLGGMRKLQARVFGS